MRSRSIFMAVLALSVGWLSVILSISGAAWAAQTSGAVALNSPNGIAFDSHGNLFVANAGSNQVLEYNSSLQQIAVISSGLSKPTRLAFDHYGHLYVANGGNNSITVYDNQLNQILQRTISAGLATPLGIAVDAYEDVYVSNNATNDVKVFNIEGELIETLTHDNSGRSFSAPGVMAIYGLNLYVGTGPSAGQNAVTSYNVGEFLTNNPREVVTFTDQVNTGPTGIAFDKDGNVYVSDFYSNTATKYDPKGKLVLVISDQIAQCEGIAVDKSGNIYVANSTLNTVTEYNAGGTLVNTIH